MPNESAPPPSVPPPPAVPPPPMPAGSGAKTGMLVLSYLGLLALIPLIVEKNDKDVQWHAKHGLVLTALFFIGWVAISIVGYVMPFFYLLHMIWWLGWIIVTILCIVKAVNGQRFTIPSVSEFADKF
jgi:uncharacterized membrane protein